MTNWENPQASVYRRDFNSNCVFSILCESGSQDSSLSGIAYKMPCRNGAEPLGCRSMLIPRLEQISVKSPVYEDQPSSGNKGNEPVNAHHNQTKIKCAVECKRQKSERGLLEQGILSSQPA